MREDLPRKRYSFSDVEQTTLSQDLEWMLQSHQVDAHAIVATAARDYGAFILRLLRACLLESSPADQALEQALAQIPLQRRKFKSGMSLRAWIADITLQTCQRHARRAAETPRIAPSAQESVLWQTLDSSEREHRLTAILHYVFGFQDAEIAAALDIPVQAVSIRMERISLWLALCKPPETPPGPPADAWVKQSLQARWPETNLDEAAAAAFALRVQTAFARRGSQARSRLMLQQGGLVTAVLILLLVVTVLSNRALIGAPPLHIAPTRLVTRIVTIPVTATPTLTLPPLTSDASPEQILQRMQQGCQCWQTARLQAVIHLYGPQNYIGLPLAFRSQAWFRPGASDDQARRFVITGPQAADPNKAYLTSGVSVFEVNFRRETAERSRPARSGLEDTQLIEMRYPTALTSNPLNQRVFSYGLRAVWDGSYLNQMLQPASLLQPDVELGDAHGETLLGREAVAFDLSRGGMKTDRLWMDTQTGILLRRQVFDPSGLPVVQSEIILAGFELDAPMPVEDLSYPSFFSKKLTWDTFWHPAPFEDNEPLDPPIYVQGRRPFTTRQPAPAGSFSPDALLFFQFLEDIASPDRTPAADLYVNGNFLGYTEMANPWRTVCRRSPDGGKIAFAQAVGGPDAFLNARSGLFWIDLAHPKITNLPWPAALDVGVDFIFSPDSRTLAIYACGGTDASCGIYLHDTAHQFNTLLTHVQGLGVFITWSPDGRYLAYVQTNSGANWEARFIVVDVAAQRIVYTGPFDWHTLSIPADSPAAAWDIPFPPTRPGLEGCALPPSS